MSRLRLWMVPGSCALASHILLNETGMAFETVSLSIKAGYPEEFLRINPKARVPTLAMDDNIITESLAVMTAISSLCPSKQLLGKSDLEVVRTYEWLSWLSGTLHGQAFGGLLRPGRYADDAQAQELVRAKSRNTIGDCFNYIENRLDGPHAVGDSFTAVDPYLFVFFRWGNEVGFDMTSYPKYSQLVTLLAERDSVKAAVQDEGIDMFRGG